jgi:hypothetical protein
VLAGRYAICKLDPDSSIPAWALAPREFYSVTRTSDELSIVCPEGALPQEMTASRGWICLKLEGPFALSETGVLSAFLNPLAANAIAIFAIATFDTDYALIQEKFWARASAILRAAGHEDISKSSLSPGVLD